MTMGEQPALRLALAGLLGQLNSAGSTRQGLQRRDQCLISRILCCAYDPALGLLMPPRDYNAHLLIL